MAKTPPNFHELSENFAHDPRWLLAERVASSRHLRGSSRLRDFLLYVTGCAIREAPEEATEQQIGIHVFQRIPGYNSSEDSIVRTHARLLRQKLASYFAAEGASEEMVIEIPKGRYLPIFHSSIRIPESWEVGPASETRTLEVKPVPKRPNSSGKSRKFLTIGLLFAIAVLGWWKWPKAPRPSSQLEQLWHPFLAGDPPLVIYSNALFIGNSITGLRLASPVEEQTRPSGDRFVDSYTGVGEAVAIHELTQLFDAHKSEFILKRSQLVTWDEAKLKNLIFIGAQSQNPASKVLPSTTDFTIVWDANSAGIINLHPKLGEPARFSRPEHPLTKDYAILALLPGAQPGKWMFVFSGLTTFGTEAAVEYSCHPETVTELVHAGPLAGGKIQPFEAVLEVTVNNGVPLQTKLVSVHVH